MSGVLVKPAVVAVGGVIFALAVAGPTVALLVDAIGSGETPWAGWELSARQWQLLQRSVVLAAAATGLSVVLALPGAYLAGHCGRLADRPWWVAMMVCPLLLPPMVYAFGWQRLVHGPGVLQCVWVWSAWAWPIPALLIGSGWLRLGQAAYEAALLVTSPASAFVRAALPALWRHVAACVVVLLVLFLGEYSVPHACLLTVYATDLLGLAETNRGRSVEVLSASWPLVGVLGAALLLAAWMWRRSGTPDEGQAAGAGPPTSRALTAGLVGMVGLTALLPVGALAWRPSLGAWLIEAWRTYNIELLQSLGVCVGAGAAAVAMGVGLALAPFGGRVAAAWVLVLGVAPGALVGEALIRAYLHVEPVYDHWPIVVLAYVARFGWVGLLVGWVATRTLREDLVAQARTDGASEFAVDLWIRLRMNWPTLACGVCVVAALSAADVTAVSLVRVPGIGIISLELIEKFHRLEIEMLVSLSLWLVAAAVPGAVLVGWAMRRR